MEYIQFGLGILIILVIYIVIIGAYMKLANYIGEAFGIGNFFIKLWKKIRRYK